MSVKIIKKLIPYKTTCSCRDHPELRQTGFSAPNHAEWNCPICRMDWYNEPDGRITNERPFSWPAKA